jgi:ankyrin repeat protein
VVRYLVEEGKADVNKATTDDGTTPLYIASENGNVEVVRYLVEEGKADVNKATTDDGAIPLFAASQNGHVEVVRYLVEEGKTDVNQATASDGTTPLLAAISRAHWKVVEYLLEGGRADVNQARADRTTPLEACLLHNDFGALRVIKQLVVKLDGRCCRLSLTSLTNTPNSPFSPLCRHVLTELVQQKQAAAFTDALQAWLPRGVTGLVCEYAQCGSWVEAQAHLLLES